MSAEASWTHALGLHTRFYEAGDRDALTIVLIHGGDPGQQAAADTWRWNVGPLGERFHVLAPDRAGSGYTENFSDPGELRIGAVCDHLAAFLDDRGVHDCVLLGQSRGAFVALEVARRRPDLARALIITNSASLVPRYEPWQHRPDRGALLGGPENLRRDLEWLSVVHTRFTDDYIAELVEMLSTDAAVEARRIHAEHADEYNADFAVAKQQLLDWLHAAGLDKPVLVAWGIDDPMTEPTDAVEIFDLVRAGSPYARMHCFSRCGHSPFVEHPDEFNALVAWFVDAMTATEQ